jgi:hypothetical protein
MGIATLNEQIETGGANTNDWVASMRGMRLLYTGHCVPEESNASMNMHHGWAKEASEGRPRRPQVTARAAIK